MTTGQETIQDEPGVDGFPVEADMPGRIWSAPNVDPWWVEAFERARHKWGLHDWYIWLTRNPELDDTTSLMTTRFKGPQHEAHVKISGSVQPGSYLAERTIEHEILHLVLSPLESAVDAIAAGLPSAPSRAISEQLWSDAIERTIEHVVRALAASGDALVVRSKNGDRPHDADLRERVKLRGFEG